MKKKTSKPIQTIAVLSDVHGNLPALEAVLKHAQGQGADAFWNLGDFLGYGPFVDEVVDLLFETCSAQVIGNYDLKVLQFPQKQKKWLQTKKKEKYLAFQWAWEKLSEKNAKRLAKLPTQETQTAGGLQFLLTHGGPAAVDEAIGPDTTPERLREMAAMTDAAVILSGHTHVPFMKAVEKTTFVNPGSVGRPEGQDPRASYAIVEISGAGMKVHFHKVRYDIERLSRAVADAGLPEEFIEMFASGKNLDQVQESGSQSSDVGQETTEEKVARCRRFAEQCRYEQGHTEQVLKLSTILFKKLQKLHGLGDHELFLLTCAAILHDIGWIEGQTQHHKTAMRMILDEPSLPLNDSERKLTALIARYHRRAVPKAEHAVYRDLPAAEQKLVKMLGGILRMGDGLDRRHVSAVKDIDVRVSSSVVEFRCKTQDPAEDEMLAAQKKADLFEDVSGRKTRFVSSPSAGVKRAASGS